MLLAALLVALTVSDFGLVLEVIGSTGSTLISYVLPGITFLLVFKLNPGEKYMQLELESTLPNVKDTDFDVNGDYNDQAFDISNGDRKCNNGSTCNDNDDIQVVVHNPLNHQPLSNSENNVNNEVCTNANETSFTKPVFTYEELKMWRYLAWILVISGIFVMPTCLYMAFQS